MVFEFAYMLKVRLKSTYIPWRAKNLTTRVRGCWAVHPCPLLDGRHIQDKELK